MLKRLWHNEPMNRLDAETRTTVLSCLLEGCSIRATVRMTGVSKKCVMRLLAEAGAVAAKFQDVMLRGVKARRVQVDELWGFIYCKQKNVTHEIANKNAAAGDVWLWVAIEAQSKLVISWRLGSRSAYDANLFISDVASRLASRVQLTSDGYKGISMRSKARSGAMWITRCWSRCSAKISAKMSAATRLPCVSDARLRLCPAIPIRRTSAPALPSVRTGQFGQT